MANTLPFQEQSSMVVRKSFLTGFAFLRYRWLMLWELWSCFGLQRREDKNEE